MVRIILNEPDSIDEFRSAVRTLIAADAAPETVSWQVGATGDLFGQPPPVGKTQPISIPAAFLPLAQDVICHRDGERFAFLYKVLWRILHGERTLLLIDTDPLVHRLRLMQKSVQRDHHKMTAFLRFRCVQDDAGEHYVAWF